MCTLASLRLCVGFFFFFSIKWVMPVRYLHLFENLVILVKFCREYLTCMDHPNKQISTSFKNLGKVASFSVPETLPQSLLFSV